MPLKNSVTCLDLHKQHGYLRNIFIKKTVTVRGKQMQPYKGSELTEMLKIIKYILQCIIIDHRSSYTAGVVRKMTQESTGQGIMPVSVHGG